MAFNAVLVGQNSGNGSPLVTSAGTTVTGSTFLIALSFISSGAPVIPVDSKGNAYTLIHREDSGGQSKSLYRCENGVGGASHTASVTWPSGDFFGSIYLIEITDAATASYDVTAAAADGTSPYTVTTPTLAQADEVVITIIGNESGGTITYASSNTTVIADENDGNNFFTSAVSKQVVAATTAFTPSFTSDGSGTHVLVTATFKKIAGGGGTVNTITAEDAAALTDAFIKYIRRMRDQAEVTLISEGPILNALHNALVSESAVIIDSFLRSILSNRLQDDSLILIDSFLSSVSGNSINTVTAEDAVIFVDSFISYLLRIRGAIETTIISEGGLDINTLYNIVTSEAEDITDSFLRHVLSTRVHGDSTLSVDDFLSSVVGQNLITLISSDVIEVTWQALTSSYFNRLSAESTSVIDTQLELSLFNVFASSLTSIIDDSLSQFKWFISVIDTAEIIDAVAAVFVPDVAVDGSKIKVGSDQPIIELGGYPA